MDYRLQYYNLKKERSQNSLSLEEIQVTLEIKIGECGTDHLALACRPSGFPSWSSTTPRRTKQPNPRKTLSSQSPGKHQSSSTADLNLFDDLVPTGRGLFLFLERTWLKRSTYLRAMKTGSLLSRSSITLMFQFRWNHYKNAANTL